MRTSIESYRTNITSKLSSISETDNLEIVEYLKDTLNRYFMYNCDVLGSSY